MRGRLHDRRTNGLRRGRSGHTMHYASFCRESSGVSVSELCTKLGSGTTYCLVGDGANEYCRSIGAEIVENEQLCSADARRNFTKASKLVQQFENGRLDTVGGVAIHRDGRSESCVSSGGLILKRDGRLGHCSQFGAAIWSERCGEKSVAVSLSGCGEALLRTHLAEKLAKIFLESDEDDDVLLMQKIQNFLVKEFTNSSRLEAFSDGSAFVWWTHSG